MLSERSNEMRLLEDKLTADWGKKSWTMRLNEPLQSYAGFSDFMQSDYTCVATYIKELPVEKLKEFKPYDTVKKLSGLARDFCWLQRKNDFLNQVYHKAREKQEELIKVEGNYFGAASQLLSKMIFESIQKKYERGDEMEWKDIAKFMELAANTKILLETVEQRKIERLSFKQTPQNKLEQIINIIDQIEAEDDDDDED